MSTVPEIEQAIKELPPAELAKFRDWFAEYDAEQWDRQIAGDAATGRLDALAKEALGDLKNGHCKDL